MNSHSTTIESLFGQTKLLSEKWRLQTIGFDLWRRCDRLSTEKEVRHFIERICHEIAHCLALDVERRDLLSSNEITHVLFPMSVQAQGLNEAETVLATAAFFEALALSQAGTATRVPIYGICRADDLIVVSRDPKLRRSIARLVEICDVAPLPTASVEDAIRRCLDRREHALQPLRPTPPKPIPFDEAIRRAIEARPEAKLRPPPES